MSPFRRKKVYGSEYVRLRRRIQRMEIMPSKHSTNNISVIVVAAEKVIPFNEHLKVREKHTPLNVNFMLFNCG
jgi:hypothetical protein